MTLTLLLPCVALLPRVRIAHPMDLKTIAEKVSSGVYRTVAEFVADLRLVFTNCIDYWTPTARYAITARYLLNEVDLRVKEMTFELNTGTQVVHAASEASGGTKAKGGKKSGKQQKHSAVTAWTPAMQQAAAAAAMIAGGTDTATAATTPSTPSTPLTPSPFGQTAPVPVDFPTTASSSVVAVMSAAEHSKCSGIIHSLQADQQYGLFARPANIPEFWDVLSDYYVKVGRPNDLLTVSRRLNIRDYTTVDHFRADVALIWENAQSYYSQPSLKDTLLDADDICRLAVNLRDDFGRRWDTYSHAATNRLVIKKTKPPAHTVPATAQPAVTAAHRASQLKAEDVGDAETADIVLVRDTAMQGQQATARTAPTGSSNTAAVTQVRREGQAQSTRDSYAQSTASIPSSFTATPSAAHPLTAASTRELASGVAALPSSTVHVQAATPAAAGE